ncbi:MAG: tetratricopeptide repeat protein [Rhodovarius sp.]|nr:tetratricopeptide repeat protein [Rhodovarius sp.]
MFRPAIVSFAALSALLLLGGAARVMPSAAQPQAQQPAAAPTSTAGLFLAGRFAAAELDTAAAADAFLAALRQDPDNPELLQRAFMAAVLDGRPDALRLARRVPDNGVAALLIMGSEALAGRWDRAEARARALPRGGSSAPILPVLLAWTQAGRGNTDQALATLRPLIEQGRFRALNALHAALIADLAGRPREAERLARIALADQPEPTLRMALLAGSILARAGRQQEAQRLLDQVAASLDEVALAATEGPRRVILSTRPVASHVEGIAEAYVALGGALRAQGAGEQGMVMARLALRLRPQFGPALLLVADELADHDHHAQALAVLDQMRPDDPLYPVAQLRRAALLDRLDRLEEAKALLEQMAQALPDRPQPLIRLGDILRRRSDFAGAAAAYDRAIARLSTLREEDWPLFYARGIARERSGDWPGAEADFQQALALSPDQPYVLNYLAYTWADKGIRLEEARAMLERAVALRPQDGHIADSLGWVLFRLGDIAGAIQWLEKAVELEPLNGTINHHLGDAYWVAGRRWEAEFQWRRALTMELEPGEAERIQERLRHGLPAAAWPASLRP